MAEPYTGPTLADVLAKKRADPNVAGYIPRKERVQGMSRPELEAAARGVMGTEALGVSVYTPGAAEREIRRQANEQFEAARVRREKQLHRERAMQQMLERSCLPARQLEWARTSDPASFTGDAADIQRIMLMLEGGGIVVLLGDVGRLKTTMAALCALTWMRDRANDEKPPVIRYDDTALYIGQMRHDCFSRKAVSEGEWIRRETATVSLLILDELDKAPELDRTTASTFMLERVIKARHDARNRPTIIIANYTMDAYKDKAPRSIQSRVMEGGDALTIEGPDRRSVKPA